MVEIITILVISTIIGACSVFLAGVGVWVSVSSTFRMRENEKKQHEKYKKMKNTIERKYTITARKEDYVKIAMLMHFGRKDNKKTTFIAVNGSKGLMNLEVTLKNCDFEYKTFKTFYSCKAHVNPDDHAMYITFDKDIGRLRWDQYLEQLNFEDLENRFWREKEADDEDESFSESTERDGKYKQL